MQDNSKPENQIKPSVFRRFCNYICNLWVKFLAIIMNNLQPDIIINKKQKSQIFPIASQMVFQGEFTLKQMEMNIEKDKFLRIFESYILIYKDKDQKTPEFYIEILHPLQFFVSIEKVEDNTYELTRNDTQATQSNEMDERNEKSSNLEKDSQQNNNNCKDEGIETQRHLIKEKQLKQKLKKKYIINSITLGKKNEQKTLQITSTSQNNLEQLRKVLKEQLFQRNFFSLFTITGKLGEGATAQVFLTVSKETGEELATKVFDKKLLRKEEKWYRALLQEIKMMKYLRNKDKILQIKEIFESNNHYYIVTELLMGGSLQDKIKNKDTLNQSQIITIVRQILIGLQEMHWKGVMHRDIKPDNILFREKGSLDLVLADLGFAQEIGSKNYIFLKCGTPGFVAPEIWQSNRVLNYTEKCDVFSLGVILCILLIGKNPFRAKNVEDMIKNNQKAYINFHTEEFKQLPRPATRFLQKCLAYNPQQRLTCEEALDNEFVTQIQKKSRKAQNSPLNNLLQQYNSVDSSGTNNNNQRKKSTNQSKESSMVSNDEKEISKIDKSEMGTTYQKSHFSKSHDQESLNASEEQQIKRVKSRKGSQLSQISKHKKRKQSKKRTSIKVQESTKKYSSQYQDYDDQQSDINSQNQKIKEYKNTNLKISLPIVHLADTEKDLYQQQSDANRSNSRINWMDSQFQSELSISQQPSPSHYNSQINFPLYPFEQYSEQQMKSMRKKLFQAENFQIAQTPMRYSLDQNQFDWSQNQGLSGSFNGLTSGFLFQNPSSKKIAPNKITLDTHSDSAGGNTTPMNMRNFSHSASPMASFNMQHQPQNQFMSHQNQLQRKASLLLLNKNKQIYPFQTEDETGNYLSPVPLQRKMSEKNFNYNKESSFLQRASGKHQTETNINRTRDQEPSIAFKLQLPNSSKTNYMNGNSNQTTQRESQKSLKQFYQMQQSNEVQMRQQFETGRSSNSTRHLTVPAVMYNNNIKFGDYINDSQPKQQQQGYNSKEPLTTEEDIKQFVDEENQYINQLSASKKRSPQTQRYSQQQSNISPQIKHLQTQAKHRKTEPNIESYDSPLNQRRKSQHQISLDNITEDEDEEQDNNNPNNIGISQDNKQKKKMKKAKKFMIQKANSKEYFQYDPIIQQQKQESRNNSNNVSIEQHIDHHAELHQKSLQQQQQQQQNQNQNQNVNLDVNDMNMSKSIQNSPSKISPSKSMQNSMYNSRKTMVRSQARSMRNSRNSNARSSIVMQNSQQNGHVVQQQQMEFSDMQGSFQPKKET